MVNMAVQKTTKRKHGIRVNMAAFFFDLRYRVMETELGRVETGQVFAGRDEGLGEGRTEEHLGHLLG